jgi:hypothetical protein
MNDRWQFKSPTQESSAGYQSGFFVLELNCLLGFTSMSQSLSILNASLGDWDATGDPVIPLM